MDKETRIIKSVESIASSLAELNHKLDRQNELLVEQTLEIFNLRKELSSLKAQHNLDCEPDEDIDI